LACSICNIRKEKRFCLAVHGRICAQCCGEQREVTLDCPPQCPYLQQARVHEKPRDFGDSVPEEMFPKIVVREEFLEQHEPLITGLLHGLGKVARANSHLRDRDLIGALTAMVRSQQTLSSSGLVYEEKLPNPVQQSVIDSLRKLLEEFRQVEQRHLGYTHLKDRDVLLALVFLVRLAHMRTSGRALSRAFIDFLGERFAAMQTAIEGAAEPNSRLIIP